MRVTLALAFAWAALRARLLPARDALPRRRDHADRHQQHSRDASTSRGRRPPPRPPACSPATSWSRSTACRICNGVATDTGATSRPARPISTASRERDGARARRSRSSRSRSATSRSRRCRSTWRRSWSRRRSSRWACWSGCCAAVARRRGRSGSSAAFVAVQLFTAFDTYRQTAGYERAAINFFLLAAGSLPSLHDLSVRAALDRAAPLAARRALRGRRRRRADRLAGGTLRRSVLRDGPDRLRG